MLICLFIWKLSKQAVKLVIPVVDPLFCCGLRVLLFGFISSFLNNLYFSKLRSTDSKPSVNKAVMEKHTRVYICATKNLQLKIFIKKNLQLKITSYNYILNINTNKMRR